MLADFQLVIFRREPVKLVAVWHFAGKGRKAVIGAVASVSLIPGEDFTHWRHGKPRHQARYPRTGADKRLAGAIDAIGGRDAHAIFRGLKTAHRAVKELCAARFFSETDIGGDSFFAAQHAGVGFKQAEIVFRQTDFRPARHHLFTGQFLQRQLPARGAAGDVRQKCGISGAEIDHAGPLENTLAAKLAELIPQRLRAQHQRHITLAFAIGVADKARVAVVAAFLMGRMGAVCH